MNEENVSSSPEHNDISNSASLIVSSFSDQNENENKMSNSLKMAILDIQETFPRVSKLVSVWQLDNMHHHGKQPEWEYRLLSKFSEAMKIIQETDVDEE